jgi:hypothetical protein
VPDIHVGDNNATFGANSPIITTRSGEPDERAAFRDVVEAVAVMRSQVSGASQVAADEFLQLAGSSTEVDKHTIRDALVKIGGVAIVVGQVGVPVIQAIQKLTEVLHP